MRLSTVILGGATALLYMGLAWLSHSLLTDLDSVARENRLLVSGGALYAGMLKFDLGLRGYLLTGDRAYRNKQADSRAEIAEQVDILTKLTAADPHREKKVKEIRALLAARNPHLEILLKRDSPAASSGPLDRAHMDGAETRYEALSQLIGELSVESRDEQSRRIEQRKEFLWVFWLILGWVPRCLPR